MPTRYSIIFESILMPTLGSTVLEKLESLSTLYCVPVGEEEGRWELTQGLFKQRIGSVSH